MIVKRNRTLAALLAAIAISMSAAGCKDEKAVVETEQKQVSAETIAKSSADETELNTVKDNSEAFPTASDYFSYLNEEFKSGNDFSATRLADIEDKKINIEQSKRKTYDEQLQLNTISGIISALVLDIDDDGEPEMLTISVFNRSMMDTYFYDLYYEPGEAYDPDTRALALTVEVYDNKNGKIEKSSNQCLGIMPTDGWGYFVVGIAKYNEDYYLYTQINSENMSTTGPEYCTLYKATVRDKLSIDYVSGIMQYHLSEKEAQKLWNIDSPSIRPSDTTIEDLMTSASSVKKQQPYGNMELSAFADAIGGSLVCVYALDPISYGDDIINKVFDNTDLRHYLETNGEDYKAPDIPVVVEIEKPTDTTEKLESFVERIGATVDTELVLTNSMLDNGILNRIYNTPDNTIELNWNIETDELISISARTVDPTPKEEWYLLKDLFLTDDVFGWNNGETDFLKDKVSWTDYMMGVKVGEYNVSIGQVANSWITIVKK